MLLKKLAIEHIVSTDELVADVKHLYPDGVDYVIDIVGGNVWSDAVEVLAKNGTMVFCASTLNQIGNVHISSAFSKQINILGSYGGSKEDLKVILRLLKNKILQPLIDSVYPLEKAQEALTRLNQQQVFGKVIIQIKSELSTKHTAVLRIVKKFFEKEAVRLGKKYLTKG